MLFLKCVGPFNIGRKKRSPQDTRFFINSNQVVIVAVVVSIVFVIVIAIAIVIVIVIVIFIVIVIVPVIIRASVETSLAAPSVLFSTGEADSWTLNLLGKVAPCQVPQPTLC